MSIWVDRFSPENSGIGTVYNFPVYYPIYPIDAGTNGNGNVYPIFPVTPVTPLNPNTPITPVIIRNPIMADQNCSCLVGTPRVDANGVCTCDNSNSTPVITADTSGKPQVIYYTNPQAGNGFDISKLTSNPLALAGIALVAFLLLKK